MTTLNYSLSHAIGRSLKEGDEIVITQLDHEANRGPWLMLKERGVVVREVILSKDGTLHFCIDVEALDVDYLICSAYKFYGPHVGILYCREGLLDQLEPDRLRTQDQTAPYKIETGTLNHAAIAGVKAAVEYIAAIGSGTDLRSKIVSAMSLIGSHERFLASTLYDGLMQLPAVTIYGQPFGAAQRAPTISFTIGSQRAEEVCARLGDRGFCTWDGHFYALRAIEVLGLLDRGGVTRVGVSLYNTLDEITRLLEELKLIAADK
jgi:selenocysteine lyase/cysteine desulfurase